MCNDIDTTYKFSELSERAKQKVRNKYTADGYLDYEWWDSVFEDAVDMGKLLGIEISTTSRKTRNDKTVEDIDIYFSGFSSQGDGASFRGTYRCVPDAIQRITTETNDEELISIAQELTLMQVTRRMNGLELFSAMITTSGRGSHSMTMDVSVIVDEDEVEYTDEIEKEVLQLMRDFANWIYKQLEAQNDYLYSDECIDAQIEDFKDEYDESGSKI